MSKAKKTRNQHIDVTIKPWWQTPLFVAIISGSIGLSPWLYGQYQQKVIENDNAGFGLLTSVLPETRFRINERNLVDIRLSYGTISRLDSWIAFNFEGKEIELSRGFHQGNTNAMVRDVNCGFTYYFRPKAIYEGREVFGALSWIKTPTCSTKAEVESAQSNANYLQDF